MTTLSGILQAPDGTAIAGAKITFEAARNYEQVTFHASSSLTTGSNGSYSITLPVGSFNVFINYGTNRIITVGLITILSSSADGTINDYLLTNNDPAYVLDVLSRLGALGGVALVNGAMDKAQNLNDVASKATARTNLDVDSKAESQARSNAVLSSLSSPSGRSLIGTVDSVQSLRLLQGMAGSRVTLSGVSQGTTVGGGDFVMQADSSTPDDGGVYIRYNPSLVWKRIFNDAVDVLWWGSSSNITQAVTSAIQFGNAKRVGVTIPAGAYSYTGSAPIMVDLSKSSLICPYGIASIDFSGAQSSDAIWVFGGDSYPLAMYRNTVNKLSGIEAFGSRVSGKNGLRIGNDTYDYNGQCCIEKCSFHDFDKVVYCTNNTWRYKFREVLISSGVSAVFSMPSGILNSGESMTFQDCQISDAKDAPFVVSTQAAYVALSGSSILNTLISIPGAGATVQHAVGGNTENPGKLTYFKYADVTGAMARLILDGGTLNINQPALQTSSVITVAQNSFVQFKDIKLPGNAYVFEQMNASGQRTFVEGDGQVLSEGCTADLLSGAGTIPIHKSLCPLFNYGFDSGVITGWDLNTTGQASQSGVVQSASARKSSYGLRLTSISGQSMYASQDFNAKQGVFCTSVNAKVITPNSTGTSAGSISLIFLTKAGLQIGSGFSATISPTDTAWTVFGGFIRGVTPNGAVSARITLRANNAAVIDFDDVIINFI